MSYQVDSACYSTAIAAAQVSAAKSQGSIVQAGGESYMVSVSAVTSSSITYAFTPVASGSAFTVATAYSAQPCNMLGASDGMAMAWAIAAAWIGVYSIMFIARALRGETGGDYGNA